MPYNHHLPVFAKHFAQYLQDNLIGELSTEERIGIKINGQNHTLTLQVYLHDSSFDDEIYVGEYSSHFVGNQKVKQEFRSNALPLGPIHLVYDGEERQDQHKEIPFP